MPLTAEQIELRRTGITSTDISAVCGLNPYKSAMAAAHDVPLGTIAKGCRMTPDSRRLLMRVRMPIGHSERMSR